MSKLKVGDRVRVYGANTKGLTLIGVVEDISSGLLWVRPDKDTGSILHIFHPNQCRRLKFKCKAREWWINERLWKLNEFMGGRWETLFECSNGAYVRTTMPDNLDGWVHVIEKLPKKGKV